MVNFFRGFVSGIVFFVVLGNYITTQRGNEEDDKF